jgi:hypothetical protein
MIIIMMMMTRMPPQPRQCCHGEQCFKSRFMERPEPGSESGSVTPGPGAGPATDDHDHGRTQ